VLPTFAAPLELHTRRCVLRQCQGADLAPWAEMNADPEVRRYLPSLLSGGQAGAEADRSRDAIARCNVWQRGLSRTPRQSRSPTSSGDVP
jgi:hypothetical protein